jgi:hypothetical protein
MFDRDALSPWLLGGYALRYAVQGYKDSAPEADHPRSPIASLQATRDSPIIRRKFRRKIRTYSLQS